MDCKKIKLHVWDNSAHVKNKLLNQKKALAVIFNEKKGQTL